MSLQAKGGVRSRAVQAILDAAKPGGELAKMGVLGRLGDLATIAEEYDVAITTACGLLDHIVVQTTAGAQRCLDFLRRHNAGRANLVALDKLKKGAHDVLPATPEGAPLLFSLLQPKNFAIAPALYLGVGNTLVAPDLDTATRWAYEYERRWRVVTLDGKLIETTGTMSGGGKSPRRGGMLLSVRAFDRLLRPRVEYSPFPHSLLRLSEQTFGGFQRRRRRGDGLSAPGTRSSSG
jgi:structural maintenance of chromosome 4